MGVRACCNAPSQVLRGPELQVVLEIFQREGEQDLLMVRCGVLGKEERITARISV